MNLSVMRVYRPLETVVRTVPLGLRCLDIATRAQVSGGLSVTATPKDRRGRPTQAFVTRSGVYALQDLPGLRDFEFADDEVAPSPPFVSPPGREFVVRVEDARGRYLSYALILTLPRRGLLTTYLFSSPTRTGTPGLAVIRGSLRDSTRHLEGGRLRPAAFARVEAQYEVTSPPTVYVALADWRGEFALFLPAPNPLRPPAGDPVTSPNTSGRKTIAELRWPLTLQFFYQPQRQEFVVSNERGQVEVITGQADGVTDVAPASGAAACVPILRSLLNQAAAEVLPAAAGTAAASLQPKIEFGKELVVRTADASDSGVWLVPPAVVSP
jgi:hypothetical protein